MGAADMGAGTGAAAYLLLLFPEWCFLHRRELRGCDTADADDNRLLPDCCSGCTRSDGCCNLPVGYCTLLDADMTGADDIRCGAVHRDCSRCLE